MRTPLRNAMASMRCKRSNLSSNLEKLTNPATHPAANTISSVSSICRTAARTGAYIPINTSMKLPDIPGKIIAHIAIAPAKNNPGKPGNDATDGAVAIATASATPILKLIILSARFSTTSSRNNSSPLASTKPEKNAHSGCGWTANNQ